MDPEQLVAQLAELRNPNQQLHQALQQVQQQQAQQQGLVKALTDLPQTLAQTESSAVAATANSTRTHPTLVDTKHLGKPPPLKNTEIDFVSWARRTENFVASVHPGARDVLTWAVEVESATVMEANAASEILMPWETLQVLADLLYTVLMTLVESESFDILVGSGSREGLEAWRRLHKRWDPLTMGRARGLLRKILSPGRAKLGEPQGAVGRLEDLMRRYTQRRDARSGQRHMLVKDIRMAALEALLPEELERDCQLQRARMDKCQKLTEEVVLYAEERVTLHPSWAKLQRLEKTKTIQWMLEVWVLIEKPKERRRTPLAKEMEQENMVRNHQDKRTRRKFKVNAGIVERQVFNQKIAGPSHSSTRVRDSQTILERAMI